MKKQIIIIIIMIVIKVIIPIKPYIECNQLTIITKIEIECDENYRVTYTETIPERDNEGIKYHYKKYKGEDITLEKAINKIEKKKHIYKEKAKIINKCKKKET